MESRSRVWGHARKGADELHGAGNPGVLDLDLSPAAARLEADTRAVGSIIVFGSEERISRNDGFGSWLSASKVPKSVSCEITIRSWSAAYSRISSSLASAKPDVAYSNSVVAGVRQEGGYSWREVGVDYEFHAGRDRGSSRSWTAAAAYSRAAVMSGRWRSLRRSVQLRVGP